MIITKEEVKKAYKKVDPEKVTYDDFNNDFIDFNNKMVDHLPDNETFTPGEIREASFIVCREVLEECRELSKGIDVFRKSLVTILRDTKDKIRDAKENYDFAFRANMFTLLAKTIIDETCENETHKLMDKYAPKKQN